MESLTDRATEFNQKSLRLYKSGEYARAIAIIDKAIMIDPQFCKYYFNRSLYLDALDYSYDSLDDAKLAYQLAIESGNQDLKYHCRLAESQIKVDLLEEAQLTLNYAMLQEGQLSTEALYKNAMWIRKLESLRRLLASTVKKTERSLTTSTELFLFNRKGHSSSKSSSPSLAHSSGKQLQQQDFQSNCGSSVSSLSSQSVYSSNDKSYRSSWSRPTTTSTSSPSKLPPISAPKKTLTQFPVYPKDKDRGTGRKSDGGKLFDEEYTQKFCVAFTAQKAAAAQLISFLGSIEDYPVAGDGTVLGSQIHDENYEGYLNTVSVPVSSRGVDRGTDSTAAHRRRMAYAGASAVRSSSGSSCNGNGNANGSDRTTGTLSYPLLLSTEIEGGNMNLIDIPSGTGNGSDSQQWTGRSFRKEGILDQQDADQYLDEDVDAVL